MDLSRVVEHPPLRSNNLPIGTIAADSGKVPVPLVQAQA